MSANPSPPPASLDFIPPVDLKGKTCLVTGRNVGVGFETVKYFAKFGATVIFTSRSMDDARRAADEIAEELKETDPDARSRLIPGVLDLSDLKNVRESVKSVVGEGALGGMLDVLVCNAGVFPVTGIGFGGVKVTKNGFEEVCWLDWIGAWLSEL
jgi:NAD(P)-dependent dehydrogenase (short-subunit alcohol dehydrogenase family)